MRRRRSRLDGDGKAMCVLLYICQRYPTDTWQCPYAIAPIADSTIESRYTDGDLLRLIDSDSFPPVGGAIWKPLCVDAFIPRHYLP